MSRTKMSWIFFEKVEAEKNPSRRRTCARYWLISVHSDNKRNPWKLSAWNNDAVNELSQRMCQFYAKIESRSFPFPIHACSPLSLLMENSCRANLCNFHDGRDASRVAQKSMLQQNKCLTARKVILLCKM